MLRNSQRTLAWIAVALTVLLITVGGLVTNTDSGLACPDWPTCFGTPFPKLVGGVLMEHGHRYLATGVGFLTVLLVLAAQLDRPRSLVLPLLGAMPLILGGSTWAGIAKHHTGAVPPLATALVLLGYALGIVSMIRARGGARLAQGALLLVITQGLLGGVTVMYQLPPTILVLHLATSILFLGVLVWFAMRAAPQSIGATPQTPRDVTGSGLARIWLPIATLAIYLQIVLGAAVRHTGAGLVCIEWLCRGVLWPTNVHPAVHLHMAHRAFAIVVGLVVIATALLVRHTALQANDRLGASLAIAMGLLVVVQIALGIATIATIKDIWAVTAHLFVAALLFSICVALTAREGRASSVVTA